MEKLIRTCLIEERKRRKWSQQEVADRIGTTQNNVSRWELGLTTPNAYFSAKLCELFGKSAQELELVLAKMLYSGISIQEQMRGIVQEIVPDELIPQSVIPTISCCWHVPYPRNPFFTGRDGILGHLHSTLHHESAAILSQSYTLSGLGGIGKTQTAIEYAYRYANSYAAIFWINAETVEQITSSFIALANLLDLPEKDDREQRLAILSVTRWLTNHDQWLLIFDNIENIELIKGFVPPARSGSLLFTSRKQALGISAQTLDLDKMTSEEGVRFLLHRARLLAPATSLDHLAPQEAAAVRAIVTAMDGFPLALDQAGAYIEETQCSLEDYLHRYRQRRLWLLGRRGHSSQDHSASVETTLSLSFRQVEQRNSGAAEALRLSSFLAPDAIPEEFITVGCTQLRDPFLLDEAISVLGMYSLIRRDRTTKTLHLHRLVQAVLQDSLSEQKQAEWIKRVITVVNSVFPEVEHATWNQCEQCVPHALQCATHAMVANEELAMLLLKAGKYLTARARYPEAEFVLKKTLYIREQILGAEHPDIVYPLNYLGILYYEQAKYAEAELFFQKALHVTELTQGSEHLQVASSLNNLGELYMVQGKYAEAETLLQRALSIVEQALGTSHPNVAYPLDNLGELNRMQKKYAEAETLLQRALLIREQAQGAEHPDVAYPLNNLGKLYREQEQYAKAKLVFQRALQIRELALGTEHHYVAESQFALAFLYLCQYDTLKAQHYYQQALTIWQKTLGLDHPQVVVYIKQYAQLLSKQPKNCT